MSQSTQSRYSDLETQASTAHLGPGAYRVDFSQTEVKKCAVIPKAPRFQKEEIQELQPLNVRDEYVKKRPPTAVISKKTSGKTVQQIRKEEVEKEIEAKRIEFERRKLQEEEEKLRKQNRWALGPYPHDAPVRAGVPQTIIKKIEDAPKGSKEKKFMLFMLLDKIREMRSNDPGMYEVKKEEPICLVRYRSSSHEEKRFVEIDHGVPGPDYYYCKDDLIRPKAPEWGLYNHDRLKEPTQPTRDYREFLDLDFDEKLRNHAQTAIILPEHQEVFREEKLEEMRIGPGAYNNNYRLVEQRNDRGVVKMPDLNEKNSREAQMDPLRGKEVFENDDLDPNLDAIKPNIKGFVYMPPTEVETKNIPEKVLFPEKWQFYDGNLNAVREDTTKGV